MKTTKSEQLIYEHLEKEYSDKHIESESIDDLCDDLKEKVQRKNKKSISVDKVNIILSKFTTVNKDGSLKFKPMVKKSMSSIKLNINNENIDNVEIDKPISSDKLISSDKPILKDKKKINFDMFEEVDEPIQNNKKIKFDMFEEVDDDNIIPEN